MEFRPRKRDGACTEEEPDWLLDFARAKARFMEENSLDDLLKLP